MMADSWRILRLLRFIGYKEKNDLYSYIIWTSIFSIYEYFITFLQQAIQQWEGEEELNTT